MTLGVPRMRVHLQQVPVLRVIMCQHSPAGAFLRFNERNMAQVFLPLVDKGVDIEDSGEGWWYCWKRKNFPSVGQPILHVLGDRIFMPRRRWTYYVIDVDLMEFCHSHRYPAADLWITNIGGSESNRVKMLFYTTIIERSKDQRANFVVGRQNMEDL